MFWYAGIMPVFLPMGAVVCRYPQKFGGAGAGAGNGFLENLASLPRASTTSQA